MGVDYTSRRVVGSTNLKDIDKLPKEVRHQLRDDRECYFNNGRKQVFNGMRIFGDNYGDNADFAFGWVFQSIEFTPKIEVQVPQEKINALLECGIEPEIISFVEVW